MWIHLKELLGNDYTPTSLLCNIELAAIKVGKLILFANILSRFLGFPSSVPLRLHHSLLLPLAICKLHHILLRYGSSTLILYKELSSTIFQSRE